MKSESIINMKIDSYNKICKFPKKLYHFSPKNYIIYSPTLDHLTTLL